MIDYNEIIQVLECCGKYHVNHKEQPCEHCPFNDKAKCVAHLIDNTIGFINHQQAEIERLKDILYDADGVNLVNYWHQQCKIAENGCRNLAEENETLKAEIERLQKENNQFADIGKMYSEIKSEVIKEYREKAAIKLAENARSDYWHWIDDTLYEVEKELIGDAK